MKRYALLICLMLTGLGVYPKNKALANGLSKPADVLAKFLAAQFSGEEDLLEYVCFSSKKVETKTLSYHLQDGMFYDFRYDSYIFVNKYKIESHQSHNKVDTFVVDYSNIGEMKSRMENGSLINYFVEGKKNDHVQYRVVKKNDKHCVLDPPRVRVNPIDIINKYRELKYRLYNNPDVLNAEGNNSKSMLKDIDMKLNQLQKIVDG